MFVNESEVNSMTGVEVDRADIIRAQAIIEAFIGRNESEVQDADDLNILAKAVAFQTVYMKDHYDRVYEQIAVTQFGQMDSQMSLNREMFAPFIAPLAVIALRNVSWRKSRSVSTGPMFRRTYIQRWETN